MDSDTPVHDLEEETPDNSVGRRELLKALAAATVVPDQWIKPVIEPGLLPPHAQASPLPRPGFVISGCQAAPNAISSIGQVTAIEATVSPTPPAGTMVEAVFTSNDPDVSGPLVYAAAPTDAFGVAVFPALRLTDAAFQPPFNGTRFTLTFRFQDRAAFGQDTCAARVTVSPAPPITITAAVQPSNLVVEDCDRNGQESILIISATLTPSPAPGTLVNFAITPNGVIVTPLNGPAATDAAGVATFNATINISGIDNGDSLDITFTSAGATPLTLTFTMSTC